MRSTNQLSTSWNRFDQKHHLHGTLKQNIPSFLSGNSPTGGNSPLKLNQLIPFRSNSYMTWRDDFKLPTAGDKFLVTFAMLIVSLMIGCSDTPEAAATRIPAQPRSGIIFTSDRNENWDVFLIQADGSGLNQLTDSQKVDADPAWSADGRRIAFRSRRDGSSDIFIMDPDGSNPVNLINDPEMSLDDEFAPQWSPDGETLSIYTDRYPPRGSCLSGFHQIAMLVRDGNDYQVDLFDTIPGEQYSSTWSPDGRFLAFSSACGQAGFKLYMYDTQSGDTSRITDEPVSHTHPAWSHDGRFLAFAKYIESNNEIFLLDLDSNQQIRLTDHPANDTMPSWSPDDSQIAFVSNREGNKDIYIMNADGSGVLNLTDHPADDWYPSWSPVMRDS
jgi:TolB protein